MTRWTIYCVAVAGLAVATVSVEAAPRTYTLLSPVAGMQNAYPGPDGLIGTADDVISAVPTTFNGSAPNTGATLSHNSFDFTAGSGATDPALPTGFQAITFLEGTFTIDDVIATAGGGPLLIDYNVSGSEPFPGHGPFAATLTAVNGGTYNPATGAMTLNTDMAATLNGGVGQSLGFAQAGEAFIIEAADFGVLTGNAYVDNVVIPAAVAANALSVAYLDATGTVPADTSGNFLYVAMPLRSVMVGIEVPEPASMALLGLGGLIVLRRRA